MSRTRFGLGLGGGRWLSLGRTGLRFGARLGPLRFSLGRSGTSVSARSGRVFASTWLPAPPRRTTRPRPRRLEPPRDPRQSEAGDLSSVATALLVVAALLGAVIWLIVVVQP